RHVIRAGAGDQESAAFQHLHAEFVEAPIGDAAFAEILLALDEGRWIQHDHIEALALLAQAAQILEGIRTYRGNPIAEPVARRIATDRIDRGLRSVHAHHFSGTERRCAQAPAAEVAEHVEHTLALDHRTQLVAVEA